jgi:hypothetical protein
MFVPAAVTIFTLPADLIIILRRVTSESSLDFGPADLPRGNGPSHVHERDADNGGRLTFASNARGRCCCINMKRMTVLRLQKIIEAVKIKNGTQNGKQLVTVKATNRSKRAL